MRERNNMTEIYKKTLDKTDAYKYIIDVLGSHSLDEIKKRLSGLLFLQISIRGNELGYVKQFRIKYMHWQVNTLKWINIKD